jgi:hypothetical protein
MTYPFLHAVWLIGSNKAARDHSVAALILESVAFGEL